MTFPHIDPSTVVGLAGGIASAAWIFRSAKINGLKTEVESLTRQVADGTTKFSTQVAEVTAKCTALEVRCQTVVDALDRAERKVVEHYTARIIVLEENRSLNKSVQERDETIIDLQRQIIEMQNNTLRAVSAHV